MDFAKRDRTKKNHLTSENEALINNVEDFQLGSASARQFIKTNHELSLHRWYVISWGPTLFGQWAVVHAWGCPGTDWSRQQINQFDTPNEAMSEIKSQIERREKRGYRSA